ncbi:hypothetical protein NOCARDAX2BIS_830001 [Nocardioides sp. AX2bis]|nr:hypothetical protein NOCARDAX2BIS_830001 [Nocardioides sp. AX2bis]
MVLAGLHALLEPWASRVHLRRQATGADDDRPLHIVLYDPAVDQGPHPSDPRTAHTVRGWKLVVFSWLEEPQRVNAARVYGADAQIPKTLSPEDLVDALERIHRGERMGVRTVGPASCADDVWPGADEGLSGRESEILVYICQGLSNNDISRHAHLGLNTVKTYIRSAYRKIGVCIRPQAVIWALSHGFAPCSDPGSDLATVRRLSPPP